MGWKASMIIIQNPNNFKDEKLLLKTLGLGEFEYKKDTILDECIYPRDKSINIGYFNNNIIICADWQIIDKFITTEISVIEKKLSHLFPTSEILSVACISTVNYHGYALSKGGKKIRVKSISADDGFYFDFGEMMEEEKTIYAESELYEGKRIWKFAELPGDIFDEHQRMEEFTFGVAERLLGVRIDYTDSDELMQKTVFRKYLKSWKLFRLFGKRL